MGELEPWIDENFVRSVWFNMGEQVSVKMIRDKFSGYDICQIFKFWLCTDKGSNAGYCFIDFTSPAAAAKALTLNGTLIPNSNRPFKLNWASGGGLADRRQVDHITFTEKYLFVIAEMNVVQSIQSSLEISDQRSTNLCWYRYFRVAFRHANRPRL